MKTIIILLSIATSALGQTMYFGSSVPTSASAPLFVWVTTNGLLNLAGSAPANADFIQSWQDRVGSVIAYTNSAQPQYNTSILNTRAGLSGASTKSLTNSTIGTTLTSGTAFVVCRNSSASGAFEFLMDAPNGTSRWAIYRGTDNKFHGFAGTALDGTTTPATLSTNIVAVKFNGASSAIWLNGSSQATGNAGANSFSSIELMNSQTYSQGWAGYMFEVRIYPLLSDAEMALVFTELNSIYGVY